MKNNDLLGTLNLNSSFLKSMKSRALIECFDQDGEFMHSYRLCRVSLCGHEYRFCLVRVFPSDEADVMPWDNLDVHVKIFSGNRAWKRYLEEVFSSYKVTFGYSFD